MPRAPVPPAVARALVKFAADAFAGTLTDVAPEDREHHRSQACAWFSEPDAGTLPFRTVAAIAGVCDVEVQVFVVCARRLGRAEEEEARARRCARNRALLAARLKRAREQKRASTIPAPLCWNTGRRKSPARAGSRA